ncbi:MAG: hypothetical protein ACI9MR_003365 [Myxococcota bacterium]|jgi:hypothetical protein
MEKDRAGVAVLALPDASTAPTPAVVVACATTAYVRIIGPCTRLALHLRDGIVTCWLSIIAVVAGSQ